MFEQNKDFFPTPKEVVEKMIAPFLKDSYHWYWKNLNFNNILEPSAWKGDIIEILKEYRGTYANQIYVFEKDLDLQEILKKKRTIFLWDDFLDYDEGIKFDLIIMNPPFSNWVDHLLKAWEISKKWTEIVCLLNNETIKNPYSKKRQTLLKIIEDNGWTIENLGKCFDNAERKTGVDVCMIRLTNKTAKDEFDFNIGFDKEKEELIEDDFVEKWLMWFNKIESIVAQYKQARELFKETYKQVSKLEHLIWTLADYTDKSVCEIIKENKSWQGAFIDFVNIIKRWVWTDLIQKSKIEKYMSSKLKNNFWSYVNDQQNVELSEKNIKKFIEFIFLNKSNILENSIVEVFEELTKYDKENRYFPEGWKTNDNWKVNKKFILNWIWLSWDNWKRFWTRPSFNYFSNSGKLEDIDKVMCYISWKDYNQIYSINNCIRDMADGLWTGVWKETDFFKVKIYKKGSIHLEFKDEFLWKEFNVRACKLKNWLPKWEWEEFTKQKEKKQEQENILKLN